MSQYHKATLIHVSRVATLLSQKPPGHYECHPFCERDDVVLLAHKMEKSAYGIPNATVYAKLHSCKFTAVKMLSNKP